MRFRGRLLAVALLAAAMLAATAVPAMAATKRQARFVLDAYSFTADRTEPGSVAVPVVVSGVLQQRVPHVTAYRVRVKKYRRIWHRVDGRLKYYTVHYHVWETRHKTTYKWEPLPGQGIASYATAGMDELAWDAGGWLPAPAASPVATATTGTDGRFSVQLAEHDAYYFCFAGNAAVRRTTGDEPFIIANLVGTSIGDPSLSVEDAGDGMSRVTVSYPVSWNTEAATGGGVAIVGVFTQEEFPGMPVDISSLRSTQVAAPVTRDGQDGALMLQTVPSPGTYGFSFLLPTESLGRLEPRVTIAFTLSDFWVVDGSVAWPGEEAECRRSMASVMTGVAAYNATHPEAPIDTASADYGQVISLLWPDYLPSMPYCPSGGDYSFDAAGDVSCSLHGPLPSAR